MARTEATRINVKKIQGLLEDTASWVGYKYRSGARNGDTLRISTYGSVDGPDFDVLVLPPGGDPADPEQAAVVHTISAVPSTVVFEPGGNCDIYIYVNAINAGFAVGTIET